MKITPINFTTFLEPELLQYWEDHRFAKGKKVSIQRTHNLKMVQTVVNAVARSKQGESRLLASVQLVQIPQQEQNPALNVLIHLPHLERPEQLLMVFKSESDCYKWSQKIIEKLRMLMISAPDDEEVATKIPAAETKDDTDLQPEADAETEEIG